MLTTDNLLYLAQSIPNFCGVYSINCLPKLQALNCNNVSHHHTKPQQQQMKTLIVNLDTDNLPGSHWVSVALNGEMTEIFDSYGRPPPPLLQSWAGQWTYVPTMMIQHPDADTCGYYALIFCVSRPYCRSLLDTVHYIATLPI